MDQKSYELAHEHNSSIVVPMYFGDVKLTYKVREMDEEYEIRKTLFEEPVPYGDLRDHLNFWYEAEYSENHHTHIAYGCTPLTAIVALSTRIAERKAIDDLVGVVFWSVG